MRENSDEKFLVLIQGKTSCEPNEKISKVTSPIRKKLLDFSKEKVKDRFRVRDLFR